MATIKKEDLLDTLIEIANTKITTATSDASSKYMAGHHSRLVSAQNLLSALIGMQNGTPASSVELITSRGIARVKKIPSNFDTSKSRIDGYGGLTNYLSAVKSIVGNAVVAESEVVDNFNGATTTSKKVKTPATTKKKTPVTDEAPKVVKTKPAPKAIMPEATSNGSKVASIVHGSLGNAPADVKSALIEKYEDMLTTEEEAFVMGVMNLEVSKLKKKHGDSEPAKNKPMFDDDGNFIDDDAVPFRLGEEVTLSEEAFNMEVRRAKELLPNVPIKVLEDLAAMKNKFGEVALGAFDKGVRFLVRGAKEGTAYHETMHAVANMYLTPYERTQIAEEYGESGWSTAVDEKMAEDFTVYAVNYFKAKSSPVDGILSKVKNFFKRILDVFTKTRSMDTVQKVFEKTISGGFADSKSLNYLSNVAQNELQAKNVESFMSSLSEKESVTLQQLMKDNRIIIKC